MSAIINQDDIACASTAADFFGGNGLSTNQQVALVANLFAEHREKAAADLGQCADVLLKAKAWIDEAKPLLEEGGRDSALLKHLRIALKELVEAEEASEQQFTADEIDRIEAAIKKEREFL